MERENNHEGQTVKQELKYRKYIYILRQMHYHDIQPRMCRKGFLDGRFDLVEDVAGDAAGRQVQKRHLLESFAAVAFWVR